MPIVKPMTFSDEEVSNMVAAVKTLRPDLWERFVAHERADEGYEEISREILQIIHDAHPEMLAPNILQLAFCVRKEARREAGRPV